MTVEKYRKRRRERRASMEVMVETERNERVGARMDYRAQL